MSSDTGKVPISGNVATTQAAIAAANVLDGFQSFAATTAATTVIQVPQGRTWIGYVTVSCACAENAAGLVNAQATAVLSVAGAGATPAAGNIMEVDAMTGQNSAAGTVGAQGQATATVRMVLIAPAGNAIQLQLASTQAGSLSKVSASAFGELQ